MTQAAEKTTDDAAPAVDHLLLHCGSLRDGERFVIVCDATTREMADFFVERARQITRDVSLHETGVADMHGAEPVPSAAEAMMKADLVAGLTRMSMAHSKARLRAAEQGARYLSLPDYSWALLGDASLTTDFRAREEATRKVTEIFTRGNEVHVTGPGGTDIRVGITGRVGNCCPGFVLAPGSLGSPPDIEANVSPLEDGSNGVIVVDGSIPCPEIGILYSPVVMRVADGRVFDIECDAKTVATLENLFDSAGQPERRILAECGVGLNQDAVLQGNMLTDEGAYGCVHFGFGANATVGGKNDVPFHLDFVVRTASLSVDGHWVLEQGNLVI